MTRLEAFATLALPATASLEEIRVRYKALVFATHPDRNGGDKSLSTYLQVLNQAREILEGRESASTPASRSPPPSPRWSTARCRECGAEILWVRTRRGKRCPVDANPVLGGNVVISSDGVDLFGEWRPHYWPRGATRHQSHRDHRRSPPTPRTP